MIKINPRQVPDVLRDIENELSKMDAKRLESKELTGKEKKRYRKLNRFIDWLVVIGFYHKLNDLSPYADQKSLDSILKEVKEKL